MEQEEEEGMVVLFNEIATAILKAKRSLERRSKLPPFKTALGLENRCCYFVE